MKPLTSLMHAVWIAENDLRQSFKSVRHVVWSLLFPIFMMFTFSFRYGATEPDVRFISFLIPGIVGMTAMFGSTNETMSIVWDKSLGVFDRILAAPVSSTSIIVGKTMSAGISDTNENYDAIISIRLRTDHNRYEIDGYRTAHENAERQP